MIGHNSFSNPRVLPCLDLCVFQDFHHTARPLSYRLQRQAGKENSCSTKKLFDGGNKLQHHPLLPNDGIIQYQKVYGVSLTSQSLGAALDGNRPLPWACIEGADGGDGLFCHACWLDIPRRPPPLCLQP